MMCCRDACVFPFVSVLCSYLYRRTYTYVRICFVTLLTISYECDSVSLYRYPLSELSDSVRVIGRRFYLI